MKIVKRAYILKSVFYAALLFVLFSCSNKHRRISFYAYSTPRPLNDDIPVGTVNRCGLDSQKINKLTRLILADSIPNIHSLLIEKDGKLIYEQYFAGKDEIWGKDLGYAEHSVNDLHDVRSISKSIVSACIGIAINQHLIKDINQPVFSFFPEYSQYNTSEKKNITIRQLLTMSSGLSWDEGNNDELKNCESIMEHSSNPLAFILSRPIAVTPGTTWNYNSGGTQLLAAIIKKVSGEDINNYATKNLFTPLGITSHVWIKMDGGDPAAASGLRLRSRDLLKFAMLYANHGIYNQKQILPSKWVDSSSTIAIKRPEEEGPGGYGYQFWIDSIKVNRKGLEAVAAKGNGGQRIFVLNPYHMIVIITVGNYGKSLRNDSQALFIHYIIPAIQ
ncbi:CubicO group peptidase (beta-lactamase class C family) [Mucilaginibacter frigoritolerans]|uniref:CubicO group peptidase (Beta-lactamase class C family) n=1 Tax=Mucilaginibacter frigoritolerans TaxID=652788 RepID=A0A562U516_9SPHI|nr:serine hydrolase [Mucilaginibacter frigoritolerans]TWJ00878.1 CubicO group peptidase (beta-lactamase class C family) [Mucilaginibacter frigoritolerans]